MKNIICKIYLRKFSTSICQSQVKPISQNQANHQNFPMNIPSFSFSSTLDIESTLTLLSVDQYVLKGEQLIHQKNGRSKVFLPLKFENTAQFQLHIPPTHPMDYGTHGMQYIEVIYIGKSWLEIPQVHQLFTSTLFMAILLTKPQQIFHKTSPTKYTMQWVNQCHQISWHWLYLQITVSNNSRVNWWRFVQKIKTCYVWFHVPFWWTRKLGKLAFTFSLKIIKGLDSQHENGWRDAYTNMHTVIQFTTPFLNQLKQNHNMPGK